MFDIPEQVTSTDIDKGATDLDTIRQTNTCRHARSTGLENEILILAGQLNAAEYRFIKLLGEFDDAGGWQGDGINSFAHWLNWKIGMGMVMGREKVRVARALPDLPLIENAFSSGLVSYTKVRAMTRVATPENEKFLLSIAEHGTANHMEYLVRKYKFCKQLEEPRENESWKQYKDLGWYQDETGMIVINARLPPEEGELVIKALELIQADNKNDSRINNKEMQKKQGNELKQVKVDSKNVSAETSNEDFSEGMSREGFIAERASALTQLAETYLNSGHNIKGPQSIGEKYQIFLHINANAANIDNEMTKSDHCSTDRKRFLSPTVAKRLACDANLTTVIENDRGEVLNIGRRSRIIPRAISHALRIRDGGCRFPGCCQKTYTDSHHIKHWADGGETSMDNLVTLCRFHHGLLHKGEYRIHRDEQNIVFTNSRNMVITHSFFPQFPDPGGRSDCLDPGIDENTAKSKWMGDKLDIQHTLECLFQLE